MSADDLRKSLGSLDVQRKSLEMESEAIVSELTSRPENGGDPMGIDTPLVDAEGYPRGDIDVYRARELRQRLSVIRTDHKALMKQIESLLAKLAVLQNPTKSEQEKEELAKRAAPKPKPKYDPKTGKWVVMNWDGSVAGVKNGETRSFNNLTISETSAAGSTNCGPASSGPQIFASQQQQQSSATTTAFSLPFAKIDEVSPGSPAAKAGLCTGDLMLEFGPINHTNDDNLRALMGVVTTAAGEQQEVAITIQRSASDGSGSTTTRLGLTPKPWAGRGLIGCHIIPYSAAE